MIFCYKCKELHPDSFFYKDKTKLSGIYNLCKKCCAVKSKKYRSTRLGRIACDKIKLKRYGLTIKDYDKLYAQQKGKCKLCGLIVVI